MKETLHYSILLLVSLLVPSGSAQAQSSTSCIACHGNPELLGPEAVQIVESYKNDVHGVAGLSCHHCHGGNPDPSLSEDLTAAMDPDFPNTPYRGTPARQEIPRFCGRCHSDPEYMRQFRPDIRVDQEQEYWTSRHGLALRKGDPNVATCVDCHGIHGIRSVTDVQSSVFARNVADTCGHCHADSSRMEGYEMDDGQHPLPTNQVALWKSSVHGAALLEREDLSAPTCNDCHGNHGAVPPGVESISFVCGQCHGREAQLFRSSPKEEGFKLHGEMVEGTQGEGCQLCHELPEAFAQIAPVRSVTECATCHGNHGIVRPTISMVGRLPESPCENCHGLREPEMAGLLSERPELVRQTLDELLSLARELGLEDAELHDWLVDRALELPFHSQSGPEGSTPRPREEFALLFEKFRIGKLRVGEGTTLRWRVRCGQCHSPDSTDSSGAKVAASYIHHMTGLTRTTAAAERALLRARRGGVETREALAEIENAVAAGIELQVLVHSFSVDEGSDFQKKYEEGMTSARGALEAGRAALGELRSRRMGLLVALFFIGLTLVGLYLKIRQLG